MSRIVKSIIAVAAVMIVIGGWQSAYGWTNSPFGNMISSQMATNDTILIEDTICYGELPYQQYGFNITDTLESNNVIDTIFGGDGGVTILHLFVGREYANYRSVDPFCDNWFYAEYNVNTYPTAGTHTYQGILPTIYGCDSVFFVTITAHPTYNIIIEDTVCEGDSYDTLDFHCTNLQQGIYEESHEVMGGTMEYECDSTITLRLHVKENHDMNYYVDLCPDDEYHGHTIDTAGLTIGQHDISVHHHSIFDCDSIVTVHITVHPTHNDTVFEQICNGEDYTQYGFNYINPEVGVYQETHDDTSIYGCDSTFVLNLTVKPSYDITYYDSIGMDEDYHGHGFDFYNPELGWNYDSTLFHAINGCDSMVRMNLYVAEKFIIHRFDTICDGENYDENNFHIITPPVGVTIDTNFFQTVLNYDSIEILHLTVGALYDTLIHEQICLGNSYNENGFNIINPPVGTAFDTLWLKSVYHCDSIVKIELLVTPVYDTTIYDTICYGEDYVQYGFELYDEPVGSVTATIVPQTINGCDSIVHLNLRVLPSYNLDYSDTICQGQEYSGHGFDTLMTTPGTYNLTAHHHTTLGCDSIINVALTVASIDTTRLTAKICEGMDYEGNGFSFTNPPVGIHNDTLHLTSIYNCDSIITLTLTVLSQPNIHHLYDTICNFDPYHRWDFFVNWLFVPTYPGEENPHPDVSHEGDNEFTRLVETSAGCDSIIILHLYAYPTYLLPIAEMYCTGDSIHLFEPDTVLWIGEDLDSLLMPILYKTIHGCDSIYNITAIRGKVYHFQYTDTICLGEGYTSYNIDTVFTTPGHHQVVNSYTTVEFGCDSTFTYNVFVADTYETFFSDTICFGQDYHQNGFDIEDPDVGLNTYTINPPTPFGCDSVKHLQLLVTPVYDLIFSDTICEGGEYHDHGFNIVNAEEGIYHHVAEYQTTFGCDSIIELYLTVGAIDTTDVIVTICSGDDYIGSNFVFINPGVGIHHDTARFLSRYGCDSTLTLTLTVAPVPDTLVITDTICFMEDYNEHGFSIINPNVGFSEYDINPHTIYGCDSVIHLNLNVMPIFDTLFIDTICPGSPYHNHGFDLDSVPAGMHIYTDSLTTTVFGCDSIVRLQLSVGTYDTSYINDVICFGESYDNYGFHFIEPSAGMHFDTIINCDSVTTIQLMVGALDSIYITDSICFGQSYYEHGFSFESPDVGTYLDTLVKSSIYGCDSTLLLTLVVSPLYDTVFTDTICFMESYNEHGFNITNPEVGQHTYEIDTVSASGCDSVIHLNLLVSPIHEVLLIDTIVVGQDYHEYNFDTIQPAAGIHILTDSLETKIFGCDSIVTLQLIVGNLDSIYITDTICFGEDYADPDSNFYYENPGVGFIHDTVVYKSMYGYDSTIMITLYVAPVFDTLFTDTICYMEDYTQHGFNIINPEVGTHTSSINPQTILGCDSIINLNLYVAPIHDIQLSDTICFGEEYHNYNFDTTGLPTGIHTIIDSLETVIYGCDSIVTLHLIVGALDTVRYDTIICFGENYSGNDFFFDSPEIGFHRDTARLVSRYGCDSTRIVTLYVAPIYDTTLYDTVCFGNDYNNHGFILYDLDTVGWVEDSLILNSEFGCDSTVRLNLYVAPIYDTVLYDTVCHTDLYNGHGFTFETDTLPTGWNYITRTDTTVCGCDSIINLHYYVAPIHGITILDTMCVNGNYLQNGFELDSLPVGTHLDTLYLNTIVGCDSIIYLELYVAPIYDTTFNDTICTNEGFHNQGFHLTGLPVGMYHDTLNLLTTIGCDSIIYLNLYVAPIYDTQLHDVICIGEDYHGYNFDTISPAVGLCIMHDTLQTMFGCDSLVTMNLIVGDVYDDTIHDAICQGENYNLHNFHVKNPNVGLNIITKYETSSLGCDSTVTLSLYVNPNYNIHLCDTICIGEDYHANNFDTIGPAVGWTVMQNDTVSSAGCDSITVLHLLVGDVFQTDIIDSVCYGTPYYENSFDLDSLNVGVMLDTIVLPTILGCDSTVCLELHVLPSYDITYIDTICFGDSYHNDTLHFDTISPAAGVCMMYQNLETTLGCDSIVTMNLIVGEFYETHVSDSACVNEGYHDLGFDIDNLVVGLHLDTLFLSSRYGCDSTVCLELYVNPIYDTLFTDTICANEGYHEQGFELDSLPVGWHNDTLWLLSASGCDSVVALQLYVAPIYDTLFTDTICFGESYYGHGFNLDSLTVGTHLDTLFMQTTLGCDSLVRLDLFVAPTYNTLITDTVCYNEQPYQDNGFNLDSLEVGWHNDTLWLSSVFGCDSTVCLELLVTPIYETNFSDTTCFGEGYLGHGFEYDSLNLGWHNDTLWLSSTSSCDSVVTLQLYVAPVYDTLFFDTVCFGESYYGHGFSLDSLSSGLNLDTLFLQSTFGCDSLIFLRLYVAPTYDITISDTICTNEGYHQNGFEIENIPAGWYHDTLYLQTTLECDSVVTLQLYVAPIYDTLFTDTICHEEDYHKHGFDIINPETGWLHETLNLSSILDCDSVVRLDLYVAPIYYSDILDSICEDEDYQNYGLELEQLQPGIYQYQQHLFTELGCDSIFDVTLKVLHHYGDIKAIDGIPYVFVSTDLQTGEYYYSVDSIPGCSEYHWSIDYIWIENGQEWVLESDLNRCHITVTSKAAATLNVWAGNMCDTVSASIDLNSSFFSVGENDDIDVEIYPNPFKNTINVECANIVEINIFSITDVPVRKLKFDREDKVTINLSDLPAAAYLIEIVTPDKTFIRQLTKTRY